MDSILLNWSYHDGREHRVSHGLGEVAIGGRMKRRWILAFAASAFALSQWAVAQVPQTAAPPAARAGRGPQDTLLSPEVHPDRTVTFRIRAPQASAVTLTGDWLATPASSTGGQMAMTKDASGVWSVTSAPLEPTVHLYFFTLDGLAIADPINPKIKL